MCVVRGHLRDTLSKDCNSLVQRMLDISPAIDGARPPVSAGFLGITSIVK
jgi:hypothetical protein